MPASYDGRQRQRIDGIQAANFAEDESQAAGGICSIV